MPVRTNILTNEQRQNRPGIQVAGVDNGADRDTAKVWEGVIRHIKYASKADDAYDMAMRGAMIGGKGYWRLVTAYEGETAGLLGGRPSFRQVLRIKRIMNPLSVFLDAAARCDPDYHTARFGFVVERRAKAAVQDEYEIANHTWHGWMQGGGQWVTQDECLVADYYCKEEQRILLAQLVTGEVRYMPVLTETDDEEAAQRQQEVLGILGPKMLRHGILPLQPEEQGMVVQTRSSRVPIVWWYKTNGYAILEQTLWPGQYIPIIPVLGQEVVLEDDVDYQGFVRNGRGAQQLYNYGWSLTAETAAMMPKVPYRVPAGGISGYEDSWRTANTGNHAYLIYNVFDDLGRPIPPPQRDVQDLAIQGLSAFMMQAAQALNETMGIHQAFLGEPSNEKSGIAIQRRKAQGQLAQAHFPMNMGRALLYEAQQIMDVAPLIYHEPGRVLQIIGEDGTQEQIQLQPGRGKPQTQSLPAQQLPDGSMQAAQPLPEGIAGFYDLNAGTYDVILQTGANYETKREETAANVLELAKVVPQLGQIIPDILISTQDFEGADVATRRLKRTIPPQVLGEDDEQMKPEDRVVLLENQVKQMQAMGQQLQAQMQQLMQVHQQTQQENDKLKLQLQAKHQDYDIDRAALAEQRQVDIAKAQVEQAKVQLEREKFEFEKQMRLHDAMLREQAQRQAHEQAAGEDEPSRG
jgi:hypothetical protein